MITRQSVVNQIELVSVGHIQIRFSLDIVENGKIIAHRGDEEGGRWHRTLIEVGEDCTKQIADVNSHLSQMGYPPVKEADISRVAAVANANWTPEIRNKWQAHKEKLKLDKFAKFE